LLTFAQAQTVKNLCGSEENVLCLSKVKTWGDAPALPDFLQGESFITEPLPSLESGKPVLLLQKESAVELEIHKAAGTTQQKNNPLSGKRIVVTRAKTQSESSYAASQPEHSPTKYPLTIGSSPDHMNCRGDGWV
jgi:hypothetical protein